jgi:hypothetical protein
MTMQLGSCYTFIVTPEVEREIRAARPDAAESPILCCPYKRFFYYLNLDGVIRTVEYDEVTSKPYYHHDDPRSFADDPAYFMKFPLTAALDEQ